MNGSIVFIRVGLPATPSGLLWLWRPLPAWTEEDLFSRILRSRKNRYMTVETAFFFRLAVSPVAGNDSGGGGGYPVPDGVYRSSGIFDHRFRFVAAGRYAGQCGSSEREDSYHGGPAVAADSRGNIVMSSSLPQCHLLLLLLWLLLVRNVTTDQGN